MGGKKRSKSNIVHHRFNTKGVRVQTTTNSRKQETSGDWATSVLMLLIVGLLSIWIISAYLNKSAVGDEGLPASQGSDNHSATVPSIQINPPVHQQSSGTFERIPPERRDKRFLPGEPVFPRHPLPEILP